MYLYVVSVHAERQGIAARLRAFRATEDAGRLWPDVSTPARLAAQRQIYDVTACIITGRAGAPRLVTGPDDTRALGIAAHVLGMGALLGYWIETGILEAEEPVRALMAEHLEHGRKRALLMAGRLETVLEAINARGVEPIVLKGAYTGVRYFPEPGIRPSSDIDLLVEPERLGAVRKALHDLDFVEYEVNPNQTTWCPPGESRAVPSLELDHADGPWSIDLHSSIDRLYFWGRWSRFGTRPYELTRSWAVGGCVARVFMQPVLAAHLAQHAVHDYRFIRLIRLVELVEVLRRDCSFGELVWGELIRFLEDTRTGVFAYPAFELCSRLAPGSVDDVVTCYLDGMAAPRLRRVVAEWRQRGVGIGGTGSMDERFMWARTPRQHVLSAAHQVARRAMAIFSPVPAQRLPSIARQALASAQVLGRIRGE